MCVAHRWLDWKNVFWLLFKWGDSIRQWFSVENPVDLSASHPYHIDYFTNMNDNNFTGGINIVTYLYVLHFHKKLVLIIKLILICDFEK